MKHTKNILKSLLITVMALSLLAVSCKKDEGGSKPTDPTITLDLDTLNGIVSGFVATQPNWEVDSTTAFAPSAGKGNMSVNVTTAFADVDTLKQALTTYSSGGITISAAANSTFGPTDVNANTAAKFDITINIGNNNFASGLADSKEYNISGKEATLELTITPTNKWDKS